ncbi:SIR2 family NAD-dependent protein deacylase [Arhodomonas sp. SL1]|uniref:SIR2 family NAD-dependent protein deacylase n=1 Tax=Arhodomonas sp. SL1 TaxID=3425691 RepID=UPI003F8820D9
MIDALAGHLAGAASVVALTGAGVSAASGVPTFRDAQTGLWARYDPMELATPEAFARDPQLVWSWYAWRRSLLARVWPNDAHIALAEWPGRVTVITQNVDGLHQRAGSKAVIELHGRLDRDRCSAVCGTRTPASAAESPPPCPHCGALMRPDVVWFGEALPEQALADALAAVRGADCVLSIGTSSLVRPAAELPWEALAAGVPVGEINTEATLLTGQARWSLRGRADQTLPALVAAIRQRRGDHHEP